MNRQQEKTLRRIFEKPERSDIRWSEIESMLLALGAELTEAQGSRICVDLGDRTIVLHRPHPRPVINKATVKSLRKFLQEAGVER